MEENDDGLRAEVDTIAERLSMLKAQVDYNEVTMNSNDTRADGNIVGISATVNGHIGEYEDFVREHREWKRVLGAEMKFVRDMMAKMKKEVLGNAVVPQDDWERLDRLCACLQVGTNEVARILDVEERILDVEDVPF